MTYQRTRRALQRAAELIDAGRYPDADQAIRSSGATRIELQETVGPARLRRMAHWALEADHSTPED